MSSKHLGKRTGRVNICSVVREAHSVGYEWSCLLGHILYLKALLSPKLKFVLLSLTETLSEGQLSNE